MQQPGEKIVFSYLFLIEIHLYNLVFFDSLEYYLLEKNINSINKMLLFSSNDTFIQF